MRRRSDVVDTLRQRVLAARRFGTLPPDGRLPSARALAAELQADTRVVVAAYQALEREGLVERRPQSRSFFAVASPRPPGTAAPPIRAPGAHGARPRRGAPPGRDQRAGPAAAAVPAPAPAGDEWLEGVLAQALERDLPLPAFAERVRRAVETLRIRVACVECNTDQIVWLCRELQEDYGVEAHGVELATVETLHAQLPPASAPGATPPSRLLGVPAELRRADLLVTTALHQPHVEPVARALGRRCIVVSTRADLLVEIHHLLARGPVYFVGTDPRLRAKLPRLFASPHAGANLRAVILGEDSLDAVPDGAPAYVMRTARDRLGGVPTRLRVLSTLRAFSAESRAQLLRFIVRGNLFAATALAADASG